MKRRPSYFELGSNQDARSTPGGVTVNNHRLRAGLLHLMYQFTLHSQHTHKLTILLIDKQ